MKDRLLVFLKAKGLTQAKFADSINVARAAVSHIIAGRNLPSYEFLCNTMKVYPELNMEWLMLGVGEMNKNGQRTERPEPQEDYRSRQETPRDFDESDLFSMTMESFNSQEVETGGIPEPARSQESPQRDSNRVDSPQTELPHPSAKQRKAVKVLLFYDDGTFQEF
ncbi:MAG: helix-turn-helix transcriptional regulator [Candidatus Cryptobacteroides sp.]